jgi:pre-rRNA-processing protein TSR3
MKTLIIRHRRENLKKCSLRGLESRDDLLFFSYPRATLPPLQSYLILTLDAPPLTASDHAEGLVLIDATWRLAQKMQTGLNLLTHPLRRSLPSGFQTAYPRRQTDCPHPFDGLASVEALYIAHRLMGKKTEGLLDHYHWKENFLEKNKDLW